MKNYHFYAVWPATLALGSVISLPQVSMSLIYIMVDVIRGSRVIQTSDPAHDTISRIKLKVQAQVGGRIVYMNLPEY